MVTKAAILVTGSQIGRSDLSVGFQVRPKVSGPVPIDQISVPNLDRIEKHTILETLAKTDGNQQRAASPNCKGNREIIDDDKRDESPCNATGVEWLGVQQPVMHNERYDQRGWQPPCSGRTGGLLGVETPGPTVVFLF